MTSPSYSDEEISFLRKLNEENLSGISRHAVVKFPKEAPDEFIRMKLELKKLPGSFYSRIWFIRDLSTKSLVGVLSTDSPNKAGYSYFERQLLSPHWRQGLGNHSLNAVFLFYKEMRKHDFVHKEFGEIRTDTLHLVLSFIKDFINKEELLELETKLTKAEECLNMYTVVESIENLPKEYEAIIQTILKNMFYEPRKSPDAMCKGLSGISLSESSRCSLPKLGFRKLATDRYVKEFDAAD